MKSYAKQMLVAGAILLAGCGGGGGPTGPVRGPKVSISDAVASEPGVAIFLITLSQSLDTPVTFNWATRQDIAQRNIDFIDGNGVDTIPAGSRTVLDSVVILDDTRIEGAETFDLVLSNISSGVTFADSVGIATISASDGTGGATGPTGP